MVISAIDLPIMLVTIDSHRRSPELIDPEPEGIARGRGAAKPFRTDGAPIAF
jgi:hypothetical protein